MPSYIRKADAEKYRPDYKSTVLDDARRTDTVAPFSPSRIVTGLRSFADLVGISHTTMNKILNCGIIDDAVVRLQGKIIIDVPLALMLIKEYKEKKGSI